MQRKRIAIAGAGGMARARGQALMETGRTEICALASRRLQSARACAAELGCDVYLDQYQRLADSDPDAILIEVPHRVQDEIALWALEAGFDVFIGGGLASSVEQGERIAAAAARSGRIVEAGYQGRYNAVWEETRRLVQSDELGEPVMAVTMAFWRGDPASWYFDQKESGGMPLTHLSYCHSNAVRWILGTPVSVSAMANQKVVTAPERVDEESCGVLVGFESGAFASATVSYVRPEGMPDAHPRFVCAYGGILVDQAQNTITVSRGDQVEQIAIAAEPSALVHQAACFLEALDTREPGRNPPQEALVDLRIAAAVSLSAQEQRTINLRSTGPCT